MEASSLAACAEAAASRDSQTRAAQNENASREAMATVRSGLNFMGRILARRCRTVYVSRRGARVYCSASTPLFLGARLNRPKSKMRGIGIACVTTAACLSVAASAIAIAAAPPQSSALKHIDPSALQKVVCDAAH